MTTRLPIRLSSTAAQQITEIAHWWAENRPAASTLVLDDLRRAFELIRREPNIGRQSRAPSPTAFAASTCVALVTTCTTRSPTTGAAIDVLAVWHTSRGESLPL